MSRLKTPAEVQTQFYSAIESGNVKAMMELWAEDEELVCIHPGAERLDSWELIADSWEQILATDGSLKFTTSNERFVETSKLAVCTAQVEITLNDEWIDTLLTTNVYRQGDQGWRMVVHHASPDPRFDGPDELDEMMDIDENESVVLH